MAVNARPLKVNAQSTLKDRKPMKTTALHPIETIYNGYRFRSRLEARWAVFYDALGVRYEYEKEGFELGGAGRYLPDFWLPGLDCWVEIKGAHPSADERRKAAALAESTGKRVFIFAQTDFACPTFDHLAEGSGFQGAWGTVFWPERYDDEGDFGAAWGMCSECGAPVLDTCQYPVCRPITHGCSGPRTFNSEAPALTSAYLAARQARFEHGETPRISQ